MDDKDSKQNLSNSSDKKEAEKETILPTQQSNKDSSKNISTNGIVESEKNRPEAEASSPSIFDKSFEADSDSKK